MLLLEVFGFKKTPEKIISALEKMFKHWKEHLHLAYTSQGHRIKNEQYRSELQRFNVIKQQHKQGEDVMEQLQKLKKISLVTLI